MESLAKILEGLLDTDFGDDLDKQVMPELATWIVDTLSKIKFKRGSSNEYPKCWVNAGDYETCKQQCEAFIFDFRLHKSGKYKITRKKYWELRAQRADQTFIVFTGSDTHKESYVGIGNLAKNDAFQININSYGPYGAKFNDYTNEVVVRDPALWSNPTPADIHNTIMPGWSNNGTKQRYFMLPGWCYDSIKKALLS